MTYWFTADHHFAHANIIKFCKRPFQSVTEMDSEMMDRWNEVVKPDDVVYYLGDFTMGSHKLAETIIRNLNGTIYFLRGSHDKWLFHFEIDHPENVWDFMEVVNIGGRRFTLCHYAMRTWDASHYGAYHLYGHSHGNLPEYGYSMDVGVDTNNFYPYSLEQVVEKLSKKLVTEYKIYGKID